MRRGSVAPGPRAKLRGPTTAHSARYSSPPELVAAYLDPETGYLTCGFADARVVECRLARLGLPPGPPIVYASMDEFRGGVDFLREDGSHTDCGADHVLYVVDGAYRAAQAAATPEPAIAQRIATRLVTLRRKRALSQRDVARRAGMAAPNYARVEKGRHAPSTTTLLRLAAALGCTLGDIIGPEGG